MSSVLAFVMLFSSLVMVNVVSVSAKTTGDFYFTAADFFQGQPTSDSEKTTPAPSDAVKAAFDEYSSSSDYYAPLGTRAGTLTNNFKDKSFSNEYRFGSARTFKFTPANDGIVNVYAYANNAKTVQFDSDTTVGKISTYKTVLQLPYAVKKEQQVTIKFADGVVLLAIEYISSGSSSGSAPRWTVVNNSTSITQDSLTATGFEGKNYAVLTYTGDNYALLPSKRVVIAGTTPGAVANDDGSYTFTLTEEMVEEYFIQPANIPYSAIKITNGGNRVLHLACQKHNNDVISVKMNEDGTAVLGTIYSDTDNGGYGIDTEESTLPLHAGTYTATMTGGTLKETDADTVKGTFVVDNSDSKFEARFVADELKNVDTTTTNEIKFNSIKVADAAAAERLMGGTVIGDGYFRVLGADYSDEGVYALRKTPGGKMPEGSENDKAFAIVLRCNDATDEGNDYGSAIGFKIAGTDDTTNKEFTLKLQCQAVKDIQSDGENATIGLMKINEDNDAKISDIGVYTPITSTNVENVETYEEVIFSGLKPNTAYGIYNPGLSDANGNIRIYSAVFSSSDAPEDTGSEIKEALKPNELDNTSFSGISEDGATAIMGGSNEKKFVVCGAATLNNFTKKIENGNLPDETPYDITKAINFNKASTGTNKYIQFTTSGSESDTGKLYVYGLATSDRDARPVNLKEGNTVQTADQPFSIKTAEYVDKREFNIKGGKTYTLYVGGGGCNIAYVGSTLDLEDNVITTYPVTLSGTNNTGNTVTVNVMKGDKQAGTAEIANGVFTKVSVTPELEADTYTLSADGYKFTPATIEVSESKKDFTDITIDESTELNVTFSVGETKPNSTIYIYKGDDRTSPTELTNASDSKTVTAEPNDTFIIAGKYDSAKSTYGSLPDNVYTFPQRQRSRSQREILHLYRTKYSKAG